MNIIPEMRVVCTELVIYGSIIMALSFVRLISIHSEMYLLQRYPEKLATFGTQDRGRRQTNKKTPQKTKKISNTDTTNNWI